MGTPYVCVDAALVGGVPLPRTKKEKENSTKPKILPSWAMPFRTLFTPQRIPIFFEHLPQNLSLYRQSSVLAERTERPDITKQFTKLPQGAVRLARRLPAAQISGNGFKPGQLCF